MGYWARAGSLRRQLRCLCFPGRRTDRVVAELCRLGGLVFAVQQPFSTRLCDPLAERGGRDSKWGLLSSSFLSFLFSAYLLGELLYPFFSGEIAV